MNFVYVIHRASDGALKVGLSFDPESRRRTLGKRHNGRLTLLCEIGRPLNDARDVESWAHRVLRDSHIEGEWFATTLPVAIAAIQDGIRHADHWQAQLNRLDARGLADGLDWRHEPARGGCEAIHAARERYGAAARC